MRARIQVSTDVAAIGIWDPASEASAGSIPLETLVRQGEACIVRLGGDSSGPVEVFVDEAPPPAMLAETTPIGDRQAIVVRSGEIVIDGVEYFGANLGRPRADARCRVPNGTFLADMRITKDEDTLPEPASEAEVRRIVGAAEVDYYDRTNRNGLLVGLGTWLLFPVLLFLVPWYAALGGTVIAFIGYFHVRERILKGNARYQSAAGKITPLRNAGQRPLFVVQLSRSS